MMFSCFNLAKPSSSFRHSRLLLVSNQLQNWNKSFDSNQETY